MMAIHVKTLRALTIFIIFIYFDAGLALQNSDAKLLTKKDSFEMLKKNGFKWKLTETLPQEARGKSQQEQSENAFKYEFVMRQYVAKTNPAKYGLDSKLDVDTIGVGTTGIAFTYSLIDPVEEMKINAALAQERMTQEQSAEYQHELTALLLLEYATVQKLERQREATKGSVDRAQLILKLAKTKNRIGAGVSTELNKANSLLESENIKRLGIDIKLSKARQDLLQLIGYKDVDPKLELFDVRELNLKSTEAVDLDFATHQRADYKMALEGAAASQTASEKLKGNFWPKLAIIGDVGTTDTTFAGLPGRTLSGLVGMNLTIPLNSGGYLEGKRAETLALRNRASINLQQTESDLEVQVKQSRQQIAAAQEAVMAAGHFVKLVKQELELSQKKYQSGSANSLDVATAHSNFASAMDTETEALFNFEAAKIQYFKSLGSFEEYFK
jgi:outer membrane protein TolC